MSEHAAFSRDEVWSGLLPEFASTKYVLATGLRLIREGRFDTNKDAILATLAVGVEKLVKLAHGIMIVEAGGRWPAMGSTRDGWGHAVAKMERRLRANLLERLNDGSFEYDPLLRGMLATIDEDETWAMLVSALEVYATKGRFYRLDRLAGRVQEEGAPEEIWETAELGLWQNDRALRTLLGEDPDAFNKALSNVLADTVERFIVVICLTGMHGVIGADWGVRFGADLLPEHGLRFKYEARPSWGLRPA